MLGTYLDGKKRMRAEQWLENRLMALKLQTTSSRHTGNTLAREPDFAVFCALFRYGCCYSSYDDDFNYINNGADHYQ